jgi:hypothetical protein
MFDETEDKKRKFNTNYTEFYFMELEKEFSHYFFLHDDFEELREGYHKLQLIFPENAQVNCVDFTDKFEPPLFPNIHDPDSQIIAHEIIA